MSLPTILLVDDDSMVTEMLSMLLELSLQANVITSNCSVKAREILLKDEVSLLVTDYLMPELNGINLTRALRNQGSTIPVIMLTGYCDEPELAANSEALAPFEVMVKPWNNEELLQRIRQRLDPSPQDSLRNGVAIDGATK